MQLTKHLSTSTVLSNCWCELYWEILSLIFALESVYPHGILIVFPNHVDNIFVLRAIIGISVQNEVKFIIVCKIS